MNENHPLLYKTTEEASNYENVGTELQSLRAEFDDAGHLCLFGKVRRDSLARIMPGVDERARIVVADAYLEHLERAINKAIEGVRAEREAALESELRDMLRAAVGV